MAFKLKKIGRAADNDIVLPHASVSRHHAELFADEEGNVFVRDLKSVNGTFVNNEKIEGGKKLNSGDIIRIGSSDIIDWHNLLKPGTDVIEQKSMTAVVRPPANTKKRLAIILSVVSVCVAISAIVLFIYFKNRTTTTFITENPIHANPDQPKDEPKKTVTISKLENEDPIKLEDYKGYKVSDCNKDTTLISKLAPNSNIIIQEGIVKGIEKKEVLQNNNNKARKKETPQNKGNNKASGDKTHTIKSGETLIVIAKKYKTNGCNVTSASILEDNNIQDETKLKPGDVLIIKCH